MPERKNVAAVTHIIAESPEGFDDAVRVGFTRASRTLRGITGMRLMEQRVAIRDGKINSYRVKLEVIFILEEKYKIDFASTDEL